MSEHKPPSWNDSDDDPRGLQTHFGSLDRNTQHQLARKFSYKKQFLRLTLKILFRWLVSLLLAAIMMLCFYHYEKIKILTKDQVRWFNAVKTGLYLTLGLNLAASLKGMALLVRWRLLARKKHELKEVDLILGIHSLIKVFLYGIHAIKSHRVLTAFACFMWILANLVGRLSVALTGLTYSYDSANATGLAPGIVNITDWSSFSGEVFSQEESIWTEHYAAQYYGLFSMLLDHGPLTKPGYYDHNRPSDMPIERADNGSYFYYMREVSPEITYTYGALSYKSPRRVEISSTCSYYPIIRGQQGDTTTLTYLNSTTEHTLYNVSVYGPRATVWINPRSDLPQNHKWDCGKRCVAVAAIQYIDPSKNATAKGAFYGCEVRVSPVMGATLPEHELPDDTARTAGGAIALAGYSKGPDQWEYVLYPPESKWSNYDYEEVDNSETMADLAAQYAVGAIAARDLMGPQDLQVEGTVAWVGVLVKVKWAYLSAILVTILLLQIILGLCCVAYANSVVCKDDSYLSTARLLRPVVERLGPSGCALTGEDIAHLLQEKVVYGVRRNKRGTRHHLDIGDDIRPRKYFPQGWYDGEISKEEEDEEEQEEGEMEMEMSNVASGRKVEIEVNSVGEVRRRRGKVKIE
ncbi:hypothetical protein EX30DRAFT_371282 [Ascodesmis nigricans]|uniref:Uncharacterized protein n=1 Tax=Ascodesmis nigricans TaxID=341454 RepID=A0A4S2MYA5_9PEZI|nr:hypothetical protein EX30DRAFT_371282 [Ascodesmis nigricans]